MMSTRNDELSASAPASRAHHNQRRQRLAAVTAAVGAAVLTWIVIDVLAGVDLRAPVFDGFASGQDITFGAVVLVSGLASLGSWGLLALLERWTSRPRRIWTAVAILGFLISLGGPLSGTGISPENRWLLALLHLVVAAVLIPLMYRTARADSTDRSHD